MNKRLLLIGGGILLVAILLLIIPRVFFKTPTTAPLTAEQQAAAQKAAADAAAQKQAAADALAGFPLPTTTADNLAVQARKEFTFASSKATEWRADSIPVAVKTSYTRSINPVNGKNTYIFISPSQNQYYFTLTFDQAQNDTGTNNFERALYFKADYFLPTSVVNMPIKYWKLDYIEALKKADDAGGKDIRANNQEYDVNMVLSAEEGKNLAWKIEYLLGGKQAYTISYNAFTGEVM